MDNGKSLNLTHEITTLFLDIYFHFSTLSQLNYTYQVWLKNIQNFGKYYQIRYLDTPTISLLQAATQSE